jgi:hypothetical protein
MLQKKVDARHRDQNNRAPSAAGFERVGGSAIIGGRSSAKEQVSARP